MRSRSLIALAALSTLAAYDIFPARQTPIYPRPRDPSADAEAIRKAEEKRTRKAAKRARTATKETPDEHR